MVRRWVLIGGLALGLSALFVAPGTSEARGCRGYFYGGGGYGGYWGGYNRGYWPGYYGGYRAYYPGFYGYRSYYPGYYYGGYAPWYSYSPGYVNTAPAVDYYSAAAPTMSYQSYYP